MDPVTITLGFLLGVAAAGFVWGYLKSWAKRKTDEMTNWLISKGHIRTARFVKGTYGLVAKIGDAINWGLNIISANVWGDFVLSAIVSTEAEKWGIHTEESSSKVPSEVKDEVRRKGYYQLDV